MFLLVSVAVATAAVKAELPLEEQQDPGENSDRDVADSETAVQHIEWADEGDVEYNIYKKV